MTGHIQNSKFEDVQFFKKTNFKDKIDLPNYLTFLLLSIISI